jgi:hypothetical protein
MRNTDQKVHRNHLRRQLDFDVAFYRIQISFDRREKQVDELERIDTERQLEGVEALEVSYRGLDRGKRR